MHEFPEPFVGSEKAPFYPTPCENKLKVMEVLLGNDGFQKGILAQACQLTLNAYLFFTVEKDDLKDSTMPELITYSD